MWNDIDRTNAGKHSMKNEKGQPYMQSIDDPHWQKKVREGKCVSLNDVSVLYKEKGNAQKSYIPGYNFCMGCFRSCFNCCEKVLMCGRNKKRVDPNQSFVQ